MTVLFGILRIGLFVEGSYSQKEVPAQALAGAFVGTLIGGMTGGLGLVGAGIHAGGSRGESVSPSRNFLSIDGAAPLALKFPETKPARTYPRPSPR